MWWIYLVGAGVMFVAMFVLIAIDSMDWVFPFVTAIWWINSARVNWLEDQKYKEP